jgi:hypothetical protein
VGQSSVRAQASVALDRLTGGAQTKENDFRFLYLFSLNTELVFKPGK